MIYVATWEVDGVQYAARFRTSEQLREWVMRVWWRRDPESNRARRICNPKALNRINNLAACYGVRPGSRYTT